MARLRGGLASQLGALRSRPYANDSLEAEFEERAIMNLEAMEALLAEHHASGRFCHGDGPTVADICLVAQVTPAKTFNLPLDGYPRVMRIYETCMAIPAFADAHPAKQPDED